MLNIKNYIMFQLYMNDDESFIVKWIKMIKEVKIKLKN